MKSLELTLLYLIEDNRVLLALKKRGFGEGKWNGVGGKIETGETVEQALVRECQEEIGATPIKFIKRGYLVFDEHHAGERKQMNLHVYISSKWTGDIVETEEMKPAWFNKSDIPYQAMWPADKIWLPIILSGESIHGAFKLNEDNSVASSKITKVEKA